MGKVLDIYSLFVVLNRLPIQLRWKITPVKLTRIFLVQIGGCRNENIGAGFAQAIQIGTGINRIKNSIKEHGKGKAFRPPSGMPF